MVVQPIIGARLLRCPSWVGTVATLGEESFPFVGTLFVIVVVVVVA